MGIRSLPRQLIMMGALALLLFGFAGLLGADPAQAAGEEVIVELKTDLTTIEAINSRYGSKTLDDYFASVGVYLLEPPSGENAQTFVERLKADPHVVYAERNYIAQAPEDPGGDGRMRARAISNPKEAKRASLNRSAATYLNLSCATTHPSGRGTTVAVLDTGAQLDHPALKANFSGLTLYDFVDNDTKPSEVLDADRDGKRDRLAGHGTHVAGIVDFVAPEAKIMPLRVLNSDGYGKVYTIAKAVSYAERYGTEVINLSLGSSDRSQLLQKTIGHAIEKGAVVAAAAGNSGEDTPHYPAAGNYPEIEVSPLTPSTVGLLAVSSVVPAVVDGYYYEKKSWFANYGEWVDIATPGEDIASAFPVDKYAYWSGTSMATPFISGQAALIRSVSEQQGSELKPADTKDKILANAAKFQPPPPGGDSEAAWNYSPNELLEPNKLGPGHVNVCKSLQQ